jgi:hypothetical protein
MEPDQKASADLQQRAFELADARCESDIEIFGIEVPGQPGCYALADATGTPVRSIQEAGGTLRESYEWLQLRNLASLRLGPEGIIIELHRRTATRPR